MDYEAERRFIQSYIRKERRERLLYELTNPGKRYGGLSRFCHHADALLDRSKLLMSGTNLYRQKNFLNFIAHHEELCFVLSPYFNQEEPLSTQKAVALAKSFPDVCIIIGNCFAVIQTEAERSGQNKYLLSDKRTEGKERIERGGTKSP